MILRVHTLLSMVLSLVLTLYMVNNCLVVNEFTHLLVHGVVVGITVAHHEVVNGIVVAHLVVYVGVVGIYIGCSPCIPWYG